MLQLSGAKVYYGPNPFAGEPVVVADLRVSAPAIARADTIKSEIASSCADWFTPPVEMPASGAEALAHFLLQWSLAALNWVKGAIEVVGFRSIDDQTVRVWIGFHNSSLSYTALLVAVQFANAAVEENPDVPCLDDLLTRFWIDCRADHPDSSDELIVRAARAGGIPWSRAWGLTNVWQFGWGARSEAIRSASSNLDGVLAGQVFADKILSKHLIESLGFPTPRYAVLRSESDIAAAIEKVGFPCVVKPIDQGGGKGIRADVSSIDEVVEGYRYAQAMSQNPVIVEAFAQGSDHRLLVIDGRFVGAFRREQPTVIGDGHRTVSELIVAANKGRAPAGIFNAHRLTKLILDEIAIEYIGRQGFSIDSIVPAGHEVKVRSNANLSSGGSCHAVVAEPHPEVVCMAEAIAKVAQSRMIGLDYMTIDIGRSWREVPGTLIELNLTPGLGIPTLAGRSKLEIGRLALGITPGRIPLDLVVVDDALFANAKARIAVWLDSKSGWATHDNAFIGTMRLQVSSSLPWAGVRMLLSHRAVERAMVVATASRLQDYGLPVDRADRIWLFTDTIREQWFAVLKRATPELLRGDWQAIEDVWRRALPTSWKAAWD